MTRIYPDVEIKNLRQLSVMVILRALKELKGRDTLTALDVFLWLSSEDFAWWAEWAGIPFMDVLSLLTSGRLRKFSGFGGEV